MGDINAITWPAFRSLCQQRFGPPLGTNHLSDLARLQFRGSVTDYQEAFQARKAHASYLSPEQQVQLFTGGLPNPIRTDIELHAPAGLHRAMSLARAYEHRVAALQVVPTRPLRNPPCAAQSPLSASPSLSPLPLGHAPVQPPRPFKKMSPQEMAERRRQDSVITAMSRLFAAINAPCFFTWRSLILMRPKTLTQQTRRNLMISLLSLPYMPLLDSQRHHESVYENWRI